LFDTEVLYCSVRTYTLVMHRDGGLLIAYYNVCRGVELASRGPVLRSFLRMVDFSDPEPSLEMKLWGTF